MKRIKYGRLYWLQLPAADIDRFFWVRVFRKLGILYIPWSLRFYDELYLREDRSKFSRRLINRCRELGIVTYVVQEGPVYHSHQAKWSHLPLYADQFICPAEDYEMWIREGMPKDRIKTYDLQKRAKDYRGVLFLEPLVTWDECSGPEASLRNAQILQTVYDHIGKDVLFRPDPRHAELITAYLPPHRIITGSTADLAAKFTDLSCFGQSTAAAELDRIGRLYTVVDRDNPLAEISGRSVSERRNTSRPSGEPEGVALLGAPVVWEALGFTWRKDYHNVRIFRSLAEIADKNLWIKPHLSNKELLLPFLPPDRVVWEDAEELMRRSDPIYCFWDSSVRKDCEMIGKRCHLIGAEEIRPLS